MLVFYILHDIRKFEVRQLAPTINVLSSALSPLILKQEVQVDPLAQKEQNNS